MKKRSELLSFALMLGWLGLAAGCSCGSNDDTEQEPAPPGNDAGTADGTAGSSGGSESPSGAAAASFGGSEGIGGAGGGAQQEVSCEAGLLNCDGSCVDTQTSLEHCGACGSACGEYQVCSAGACAMECLAGLSECEGSCFDLTTDNTHCGACNNSCKIDEACSAGVCGAPCRAGLTSCNDQCVDLSANHDNCGACGAACPADEYCQYGLCGTSCQSGLSLCDNACVDLQAHSLHCGDCDTACTSDQSCIAGACTSSCDPGLTLCGTECVNTLEDTDNCGACSGQCTYGFTCSVGTCVPVCIPGLTECNGSCTHLQSDAANCGSCGAACPGQVCTKGTCAADCAMDLVACGDSCVDPNTDPAHCGASGTCQDEAAGRRCGDLNGCREGRCWGLPQIVRKDDLAEPDDDYAMAVGPNGGVFVAWERKEQISHTVTHSRISAARLDEVTGVWTTDEDISGTDRLPTSFLAYPVIAVDGNGNAYAAWAGADAFDPADPLSDRIFIAVNRFDSTTKQWGAPVVLNSDRAYWADQTSVAVSDSGVAFVTWIHESDVGNIVSVRGSRFDPSQGTWSAPAPIGSLPSDRSSARVAVDSAGNAIAVWNAERATEQHDIWSSRYNAAGSPPAWSTPVAIGQAESHFPAPTVAVSPSGDAAAIWSSVNGAYVNRYDQATGTWGAAHHGIGPNVEVESTAISLNAAGNALATWAEDPRATGAGMAGAWSSRLDASGVWGEATPIHIAVGAGLSGRTSDVDVMLHTSGDAFATWTYWDSTDRSIWAARYDSAAGSWVSAEAIEASNVGSATDSQIVVTPSGDAVAAWLQEDLGQDTERLWFNQFK